MNEIKIRFKEWDCLLKFSQYSNGRPAIELIGEFDFSPIAKATINLPDIDLKKDEVCIKDYSENEGMLKTLINSGIVSVPIAFVKSGFVKIPIVKLM